MVERWPFKPMAVGSIPTEGAFFYQANFKHWSTITCQNQNHYTTVTPIPTTHLHQTTLFLFLRHAASTPLCMPHFLSKTQTSSTSFLCYFFTHLLPILLTTKNCSKPFLRTQPIQNKKHTALTIPVWSPTTVLGKPNPAWLRSSDGIRYIQGGMTVWCRYSLFIALIPKPKNFSFTSSYSLLYYRHSLFFSTPNISHSLFFAYFYYQKIPESAMIFLYFNYTHLLTTSTQTNFTHFQSVTSCGVQQSSVVLWLGSVPRYHRNISRYF